MSKRQKSNTSTHASASFGSKSSNPFLNSLEWGLAALGAMVCLGIWILYGAFILPGSLFGQLWPLPGIYFIEISLLGLAGFLAVASNRFPKPSRWSAMPWLAAGTLATMVVLGGTAIGASLIPGMLAFLGAGVLKDRRQGGDWPRHFMLFMLAALLQAVVIFAFVFLLQPAPFS